MRENVPGTGPPGASPLALAGIGIELALYVAICGGAGYMVDRWLGTEPWIFLVGSALGMVAGFYMLFRRVLHADGGGAGKGSR